MFRGALPRKNKSKGLVSRLKQWQIWDTILEKPTTQILRFKKLNKD